MKIKNNILIGGALAVVAGISYYLWRQSKLLSLICYEFVGIEFLGNANNVSQLSLNFRFVNYADIPLKITKYRIQSFINDRSVGWLVSQQKESFEIPAKGSIVVNFLAEADTTVAFSQILNSFLTQFIDKTTSKFKIKGEASIKAGMISIDDYPVNWEWTTEEILMDLKSGEECPPIT
jgi:hypothetical protein